MLPDVPSFTNRYAFGRIPSGATGIQVASSRSFTIRPFPEGGITWIATMTASMGEYQALAGN
jgi:hypothetical protein